MAARKLRKKTKQKKQYYQKNKERILERQKQRKMEKKTSMIMTFLFEKNMPQLLKLWHHYFIKRPKGNDLML